MKAQRKKIIQHKEINVVANLKREGMITLKAESKRDMMYEQASLTFRVQGDDLQNGNLNMYEK